MLDPEHLTCPDCQSKVAGYGWRIRYFVTADDEVVVLEVRLLRCTNKACGHRWHRGLPEKTIPYKPDNVDTVEDQYGSAGRDAYQGKGSRVLTLLAWLAKFIEGCRQVFEGLKARRRCTEKMLEELEELTRLRPGKETPGWLERFVRAFVNTGSYLHNHSLFAAR